MNKEIQAQTKNKLQKRISEELYIYIYLFRDFSHFSQWFSSQWLIIVCSFHKYVYFFDLLKQKFERILVFFSN